MAFERETRKTRGPSKSGAKGGARGGAGKSGGKKPFGEKKAFGDKPKSRSFGDKPKRDFGDAPSRPRKDFGDRPKRDFGDKPRAPRGDFGDKPRAPRKDFGDRPKRDFGDDRPRKRFDDDRPRRSFDDRPPRREYSEDRPKRDFGDKPRAPRGDFGDRPRRSFDDRPPRREYSEDRPKRDFGDKPRAPRGDFGDRPRAPRKDFGDRPPRKSFSSSSRPVARDDDFAPKKRDGFERRESKFSDKGGDKAEPIKGHELLFYGVHAVHAALRNPDRKIVQIWVTDSGQERLMEAWDAKRHPEPELIERRDLDRRLTAGAVHQGMAIAVEPLQDVFLTDIMSAANAPGAKNHIVVVLDEVTDPHNIGAVLRSMSAFGAKAMIVHKRNAPGITGVMAKIATGATETIPMVAVTNLAAAMEELKASNFYMLGLDENADFPIQKAPTAGRHVALVLGAEGEGLRAKTRATCDAIASIETFGDIKSLNVSNAAAIALFSLTQKQGK